MVASRSRDISEVLNFAAISVGWHDRKHIAIKYMVPNMCVSIETKSPLTRDQVLDDDTNNDKDNSMEKSHPNVIEIDKAIMVSDLHLGYEK